MASWRTGLAALAGLCATGCAEGPIAIDLLRAPGAFVAGTVEGRPWTPADGDGAFLQLHDVGYRSLPARPPSRLRFRVRVPPRATLGFACGIDGSAGGAADVEFLVRVRERGEDEEATIWSKRILPRARALQARWTRAEASLHDYAGREIELVLETRSASPGGGSAEAAWGAPAISTTATASPLVVLYVVDTLRADHTGPYGYERPTTPELEGLARDGVVFEQAIVQAPWTKPSMASIMTSLLPARHGAVRRVDRLDEDHLTLAESLAARGWSTGAAVANTILYARRGGFEQGFDYYAGVRDARGQRSRQVSAARVVDRALEWVDARRGLPTFLYVHTMDPHFPYRAPAPFDGIFSGARSAALDREARVPEAEDARESIARYDEEIAYGDRELGRFLRELAGRGLYDDAVVVFVSDHGEEFLDHGDAGHGQSLFDELVRVPLVLKMAGGRHAGRRVSRQVQGVDLMPTILVAAGVPLPDGLAGRALQGILDGEARAVPALIATQHWRVTSHGVRTEDEKYVRHFSPEGGEEYFDLRADPRERTNRAPDRPDRVKTLRDQVEAVLPESRYRYVLGAGGEAGYALTLTTTGWLEPVGTRGLEPAEAPRLEAGGRRLVIELAARPAGPTREVTFTVKPMGATVRLEGTRGGRPLRPEDVVVAGGRRPDRLPYVLPRPETETPLGAVRRLFLPPRRGTPGLRLWLVESAPDESLDLDDDTLDALEVLGYAEP